MNDQNNSIPYEKTRYGIEKQALIDRMKCEHCGCKVEDIYTQLIFSAWFVCPKCNNLTYFKLGTDNIWYSEKEYNDKLKEIEDKCIRFNKEGIMSDKCLICNGKLNLVSMNSNSNAFNYICETCGMPYEFDRRVS